MVPSLALSSGLSTAMPAFMARAAISTSGTYRTLCLKSSPTTLMPAIRPSVSTSCTGRPSAKASLVILLDLLGLAFVEALVHEGVIGHRPGNPLVVQTRDAAN